MAECENRWRNDRGCRRGDDRDRWRSIARDWRREEPCRQPGFGAERSGGGSRQGYGGRSDDGQDFGSGSPHGGVRPAEPRGRGDEQRGWWDRTWDEVSSWLGDVEAEHRRQIDEMRAREHRGQGPRGYTRSDERIREDVNDRLTDDPWIDATDIEVTVSGGDVTLAGTVDSRIAKHRAEDIVAEVGGVRQVQNNLRVRQASYTDSGASAGAAVMAGLGTGATIRTTEAASTSSTTGQTTAEAVRTGAIIRQ